MTSREPISHVDTAWLRMDRPENLMQILGVMIFSGRVDAARLQRTVAQRILRYRRFRQIAVQDATGVWWVDDPHFDINTHVRHSMLPEPYGSMELRRFVAEMASTPLNPARPRWEFNLVELADGNSALVVRVHHALADGIALVRVIDWLTDDSADALERGGATATPGVGVGDEPDRVGQTPGFSWRTVFDPLADLAASSLTAGGRVWGHLQALGKDPTGVRHYARVGAEIAREVGRLALLPDDSATRLKGKATTSKIVAWSEPLCLNEIKAVSKTLGCSVNDLLLAVLTGAMRAYLVNKGDAVDRVQIRVMVPVNLRAADEPEELGNQFGLVALELPICLENPLARLYETRTRMDALKGSYQAMLTLALLDAVGRAPQFFQDQVLTLLSSKATAVVTNVPGSPQARFLAGTRIEQEMVWVPQAGDIGIGAGILSYNGRVQFGLITDRSMVEDPEAIVARCAAEFSKLLWLVLLEPPERLSDPLAVEKDMAFLEASAKMSAARS